MNVLEIQEVSRSYTSNTPVLDGVSFTVAAGEVVSLLGRNGAGKTTLLHLAMGMLAPQAGSVQVLGRDPRRHPLEVKRRVGFVSEEQILPVFLRVGDVIGLHRGLFPTWDEELARELSDRFSIDPRARVRELSKGQARQVALLFAHVAVPIITVIGIGLGCGHLLVVLAPEKYTQVSADRCCPQVPYDFWEMLAHGEPPTVTAPWGETYRPQAWPLVRGSSLAVYNPYATGPDSSPRFVDLQLWRAAAAVYDLAIPDTVLSPHHQADEATRQAVARDAFTPDLSRGRSSEGRLRSSAAGLLLLTVVQTLLLSLFLRQFGCGVRRRWYRWLVNGLLIALGVVAGVVLIGDLAGLTEMWIIPALIAIGLRHLGAWMPLPTAGLWLLVAATWIGAYLVLGLMFARIEAPRRPLTAKPLAEEH